MSEQYFVRVGGQTAGPLSLDEIRQRLGAGAPPPGAEVRLAASDVWQPIQTVVTPHGVASTPAAPAMGWDPAAATPSPQAGGETGFGEAEYDLARRGYGDAVRYGSGLSSFGQILKFFGGFACIASMFIGFAVGFAAGGSLGIALGTVGVLAGGAIVGLGVLIAAAGQLLKAVVETAVNTKVTAERIPRVAAMLISKSP